MKYYFKKQGDEVKDAKVFETYLEELCEYAAIDAALHAWNKNRYIYWEWAWPITFTLVADDGTERDFEVEPELRPNFVVRRCDENS